MASMAVATPFSCPISLVTGTSWVVRDTHGSDLFTNKLGTGNLPQVCRGCDEGFSEALNGQFANTGANSESFHTIGPEELVTKERSDNSRDSG
jgi:hypothetical protein